MSDLPTLEEHCLSTWRLCPALKEITIFISTREEKHASEIVWKKVKQAPITVALITG